MCERSGGTGVVGGSGDGGAGLEAIEGKMLREVRARHGGQQCARVGGVVGVAAFQGLGSTGLGVGIRGGERGDAKCQVAMRFDGGEETRASSRMRLPA
jgi:hypothetical protein